MFKLSQKIPQMSEWRILLSGMIVMICVIAASAQYDYSGTEVYREVEADVYFLAADALEGRAAGQNGEVVAAEYIAARFKALGIEPGGLDGTYFQPFSVKETNPHATEFVNSDDSTIDAINVIGYIDNGADKTVVIGAHYDHLGHGEIFGSLHAGEPAIHNGADDNASGVAAILQIGEYCLANFDHANFLLIGFSGEERGLWGSNYYVKNPTVDLSRIEYMINLDMVGRLNAERKISINGVGTSPTWNEVIKNLDVDGLVPVTTESGIGASDHTSFYFEQIPAVHFFTGQHSDYHKPSDDAHLVNYSGIVSVVNYINEMIREIGDTDMTFVETKTDREPSARDFKVTLGVMPDYLYTDGGMRVDGVRADRPAQKAGIEKGDVVVQMDDIEINSMEDYMKALSSFEPGQTVDVTVVREGERMDMKVTFD